MYCSLRMLEGHRGSNAKQMFKFSTFIGGQHSIQPLVQSVVTVDCRGVGHDRDRLLIRCSITFQRDIRLQDHDVTCAWTENFYYSM